MIEDDLIDIFSIFFIDDISIDFSISAGIDIYPCDLMIEIDVFFIENILEGLHFGEVQFNEVFQLSLEGIYFFYCYCLVALLEVTALFGLLGAGLAFKYTRIVLNCWNYQWRGKHLQNEDDNAQE